MTNIRNLSLLLALVANGLTASLQAATVVNADPQAGGIGYAWTVTMTGTDSTIPTGQTTSALVNHTGAWSWQDSLPGEPPRGWTHTSRWVALELTEAALFTIAIAPKEGVPWPGGGNANRVASTDNMNPSFTIWKNWDNDLAPTAFAEEVNEGDPTDDWHTYYNRGNVEWAEDLEFVAYVDNSASPTVQRTYVLPAGKYTIVMGSNAPSDSAARQGFEATFTTAQIPPAAVQDDSYFTKAPTLPVQGAASAGVLANDTNVAANYTLQITRPTAFGTTTVNADGSFTYQPGPYFAVNGVDYLTYQMMPAGEQLAPVGPATVTFSSFAAMAGRYTGLLHTGGDGVADGIANVMVAANGAFSGSLLLAGKRVAITGVVGPDGVLAIKRQPMGFNVALRMATENDGVRYLAAIVEAGAVTATGRVEQSPFSRWSIAPMKGVHQVTMTPVQTGAAYPPRTMTGVLRVAGDGMATFIGRVGDNATFSASGALTVGVEAGPTLPIFMPMYAQWQGQVSGKVTFGPEAMADAAGEVQVFKPVQMRGLFKEGFTLDYEVTTQRPGVRR